MAATLVGAGLAVALGSPIGALPTPSGGPSCPAVGLVNGGFEEPSIVGLQHPHDDDVPGWQKGTSDPLFEVWTNATGKEPYEGRQFIEINVSAADSLFQQVELPVAGEVALGFAHRGRDGTYSMRARLRQGGVDVATIDATSPATGPDRNGWSRHQATVVVEAGPAELWMESVTGAGLGNLLDDVSLRYASCVAAARAVTVGGSPAATARMGANLVHTVVVSNVGEGPAETIVLVDGPPAGTTLVPGTLAVDGAPSASSRRRLPPRRARPSPSTSARSPRVRTPPSRSRPGSPPGRPATPSPGTPRSPSTTPRSAVAVRGRTR